MARSKLDLDDLFSSDEEEGPAPHGRFSTETLQRAYDSRATPRPKLAAQAQLSARVTPAPPTRAAAEAAQSRSRTVAAQHEPTTRRFDFLAPASDGGLMVEANATGQAALDEAACFDAACGGSSLAEHMTSLLQVVPPNKGAGGIQSAAVDAALEAAAQSLGQCQQHQALRLQRSVATLRADFRGRLQRLEREFVAQAELLADDLSAAVRAEKEASEESVAQHAATLRGSLESLVVAQGGSRASGRRAGGGTAPPPPPPPQQQLPARALITPRAGPGRAGRHAPPLSSAATVRYGTAADDDDDDEPEQPRTRRVATGESPWRRAQPARNGALDYDSD